jgi:hypothetical protein
LPSGKPGMRLVLGPLGRLRALGRAQALVTPPALRHCFILAFHPLGSKGKPRLWGWEGPR